MTTDKIRKEKSPCAVLKGIPSGRRRPPPSPTHCIRMATFSLSPSAAPSVPTVVAPRVTGHGELDGHTVYHIETTLPSAAPASEPAQPVRSSKRFSEFRQLHATLSLATPAVADAFPISRAFFAGASVKREREKKLQAYLEKACEETSRATAGCLPVALLAFLGVPAALEAEARLRTAAPTWCALVAREKALLSEAKAKRKYNPHPNPNPYPNPNPNPNPN